MIAGQAAFLGNIDQSEGMMIVMLSGTRIIFSREKTVDRIEQFISRPGC